MLPHFFRPVIGQRQQAATRGHHFARTAGNRGEAEHRDVHRHQEIVERGIVIASAKLALVRKADRVDDEVDAGPVARSAFRTRASRSEEHTSELQSLMRISYAVFCLKKKKKKTNK